MVLGNLQAPVVVTGTDHWTGFGPDCIKKLAHADARTTHDGHWSVVAELQDRSARGTT